MDKYLKRAMIWLFISGFFFGITTGIFISRVILGGM